MIMCEKYEDIIHLSRPVSPRHLPMSHYDRAAQFAPFAALTGYDDVIAETARLTDGEMFLDVGAEAELDGKLREIRENIHLQPRITVTYFRPDSRKQGGAYVTVSGKVKKIDEYAQTLVLTDSTAIDLQKICKIE
jgi:hypothetical protein